LFCGAPGAGKTTLANMLAEWWIDHELHITTYDGVSVSIDTVEKIEKAAIGGSLYGKYMAVIINECDLVTQGAQNKLLGVLERLPAGHVVFGTSNLKPVTQGVLDLKDASKKKKAEEWLVPRYASRFVQKQIKSPTIQESASDVSKLTGVPVAVCEDAARKSAGDNRQLLALISEYETAYELVS
jgi:replication-associated recombination protein RarA